jgi:hypothetical protein
LRETLRRWMVEDGLWLSRKQRRSFHQPRLRREAYGELIRIDGGEHLWFEDNVALSGSIPFHCTGWRNRLYSAGGCCLCRGTYGSRQISSLSLLRVGHVAEKPFHARLLDVDQACTRAVEVGD